MNMKEFLTKISADQVLAEKMSRAANPNEAYAVAREAGLTDNFENFTAAMKKLNDASGDMSMAEIDAVAGGASTSEIVTEVTATAAASAFIITYASSAV